MLDKIGKEFDFQQRALNLRAYRAEVIASTPAELLATVKSEMARMGKVIKAAGIRDE